MLPFMFMKYQKFEKKFKSPSYNVYPDFKKNT